MKRTYLSSLLILLLGLVACNMRSANDITKPTQSMTVFAAASLTDAFKDIATAFESQNPEIEVIFNFAGSSQLAAQLREGITADIFASANPTQMQTVIEAGRIKAGSETHFLANRLTIVVPTYNPAKIASLEDLAQPSVQLILAVEGVPIRTYTDSIIAMMTADFQTAFYNNLVSEEDNVRQVLAKVALGEADAGLVYTSDVTANIVDQVQAIPLPLEQNVVATYPIAPLVDAPQPALAQHFIDFVLSETGQAILAQWGFDPSPPS